MVHQTGHENDPHLLSVLNLSTKFYLLKGTGIRYISLVTNDEIPFDHQEKNYYPELLLSILYKSI